MLACFRDFISQAIRQLLLRKVWKIAHFRLEVRRCTLLCSLGGTSSGGVDASVSVANDPSLTGPSGGLSTISTVLLEMISMLRTFRVPRLEPTPMPMRLVMFNSKHPAWAHTPVDFRHPPTGTGCEDGRVDPFRMSAIFIQLQPRKVSYICESPVEQGFQYHSLRQQNSWGI